MRWLHICPRLLHDGSMSINVPPRRLIFSGLLRRGGRGLLAPSKPWTPEDIAIGDRLFWLVPETLQPTSGTSPYTSTGWNNLWTGVGGVGNFTVGTGSPNIIDPSTVDFKGGRRVEIVEVDTDFFAGPGAASLYANFNNGLGVTLGFTFFCADADATQLLAATFNTTLTQLGFYFRYIGTTGAVRLVVSDASGTALIDRSSSTGLVPLNVANTVAFQIKEQSPGVGNTGINDWELHINGRLSASGEIGSTQAFNTGNPQGALSIGRRSGQANEWFEGRLSHIVASKGLYAANLAAYLESLRV